MKRRWRRQCLLWEVMEFCTLHPRQKGVLHNTIHRLHQTVEAALLLPQSDMSIGTLGCILRIDTLKRKLLENQ
jgi:hypothetical protein